MSDRIDLRIPGDASAMYAMGAWLDRQLGAAIDDMIGQLKRVQSDVQYSWEGESMEAFHTTASVHAMELSELPRFLKRVRETLEAFADRLTRGRGHFAGYAEEAAAAGMAVDGAEYISPPEPPLDVALTGSLTPAAEREAASARRAYESAALLFEEIRGLVDDWNADTVAWIDTNFDPLIEQLESFTRIRGLADYLELNGFTFVGALLITAEESARAKLGDFRDRQTFLQEEHVEQRSKLRSGDPARRAEGKEYETNRQGANRKDFERAAVHVSWLDPTVKVLGAAGPVTDLIEAGVDLSSGRSPSSVAADLAGGAAGAATGARAGAETGVKAAPLLGLWSPVVGGIFGSIAGGIGGSGAAAFTWERMVPLKVRDAIDEGLRSRVTGEYRLTRQILRDDAQWSVR